MRVVIATQALVNPAGTETYVSLVAREMQRLGHEVVVAAEQLGPMAAHIEAQGIVVDTHVRRISQRLGLTREEDPVKIERDLIAIVEREDWHRFPHLVIWHGRRVCDARAPRCEVCVLAELCPSARTADTDATL